MNIIERLRKAEPDRNVVFTAIDKLKTDQEIIEFYNEYKETNQHADQNIGYILGYYEAKTVNRWFRLLDEIHHPVFGYEFGRGYEPSPEEAFQIGKRWGNKIKGG